MGIIASGLQATKKPKSDHLWGVTSCQPPGDACSSTVAVGQLALLWVAWWGLHSLSLTGLASICTQDVPNPRDYDGTLCSAGHCTALELHPGWTRVDTANSSLVAAGWWREGGTLPGLEI